MLDRGHLQGDREMDTRLQCWTLARRSCGSTTFLQGPRTCGNRFIPHTGSGDRAAAPKYPPSRDGAVCDVLSPDRQGKFGFAARKGLDGALLEWGRATHFEPRPHGN